MPAGNSIIGDCAECCVCPTPTFFGESLQVVQESCGLDGPGCQATYLTITYENVDSVGENSCDGDTAVEYYTTGTKQNTQYVLNNDCDSTGSGPVLSGIIKGTFSSRVTAESLYSVAISYIPDSAFTGVFYQAGSIASLHDASNYASIYLSKVRWKFAFKIPLFSRCYKVSWVERFVADAGTPISSVELIYGGSYRPTATASGGNGTGCVLLCIMNAAGQVASVTVLNPGSGYTTPPTVTIQAAINGGTSSTGWTATVENGKVTSVTGGSSGNYLPSASVSGNGQDASVALTMNSSGGISSAVLTAEGSDYNSAAVNIQSKVSGHTAGIIYIHFGTETAKCATWDGVVPEDYNPETPSTWPTIAPSSTGYYFLDVPESSGRTAVANVLASCDCSSCS